MDPVITVQLRKCQVVMNEPLSSIDLADSDGALDRMSGDGHPVAASSGWNILLIEDDPVVARTTNILFRLAGHRVELAAIPTQPFVARAASL